MQEPVLYYSNESYPFTLPGCLGSRQLYLLFQAVSD